MIRRPPRSTPLYSSAASDVYKRQSLYKSEDDLICAEILKYNPSSKIWIDDIKINKNKKLGTVDIILPSEEAFYSLSQNGFASYLQKELKVFGDFNIKFDFVKNEFEEDSIEDFICQIEEAEEVISTKHEEEVKTCLLYTSDAADE